MPIYCLKSSQNTIPSFDKFKTKNVLILFGESHKTIQTPRSSENKFDCIFFNKADDAGRETSVYNNSICKTPYLQSLAKR